jgi:hypothetical protein
MNFLFIESIFRGDTNLVGPTQPLKLHHPYHRLAIDLDVPLIPSLDDHDAWAHLRRPMDMILHGWSTSRFQAKQQWSRMSS